MTLYVLSLYLYVLVESVRRNEMILIEVIILGCVLGHGASQQSLSAADGSRMVRLIYPPVRSIRAGIRGEHPNYGFFFVIVFFVIVFLLLGCRRH